MPATDPVIIVGGGWAGIAAAVELARHQTPLILLESAKQLGGRARSVMLQDMEVDNGQHLLLGAYESTLDLLRTLGVAEHSVLQRETLNLHWQPSTGKNICLKAAPLPAPLHLAWALLFAHGLSLRDRLSALRFSRAMQQNDFQLSKDQSVLQLLQAHRQSPRLIQAIWEPLCLSALNTFPHEASAQVFLRTLGDAFRFARQDSDLMLTRSPLGDILPLPAMDYVERHAGQVRLGQRVTRLLIQNDSINGVELEGQTLHSQQVILATPHFTSQRLLQAHPPLQTLAAQLARLDDRPICTVYLQYPPTIRLERPMQGLLDTVSQWIFDRRLYGQDGLMAVVISGEGEHMQWDNERLTRHVSQELASYYPHWPEPQSCQVIREKRATFASTVNVNHHRPAHQTPIKGLWLAGDYTDVGLPATLEGAVRSGLQCAQQVLRDIRQTSPGESI